MYLERKVVTALRLCERSMIFNREHTKNEEALMHLYPKHAEASISGEKIVVGRQSHYLGFSWCHIQGAQTVTGQLLH